MIVYHSSAKVICHILSQYHVQCTLGDSGFFKTSRYQGIVKATVSGVFEDLKFKKVLKYSRNCSLHNTLIPNLVKTEAPSMYYANQDHSRV